CLQVGKVLQELDAPLVTFFRMKLHAINITGVNAGCKSSAVVRDRKNGVLVFGGEIVRMQEIESPCRSDAPEQSGTVPGFHVVPSHVGQVSVIGGRGAGEFSDFSIDPSQPFQ